MTFKKVFIIGLLSASIIGLISFGIKTKSFNKENFKPKILNQNKSTLRVNAEGEVTPISLNWLLNETLPIQRITFSSTFKSNLKGNFYGKYNGAGTDNEGEITPNTTFKAIDFAYLNNNYHIVFVTENNKYIWIYDATNNIWSNRTINENSTTAYKQQYSTFNARILKFTEAPTGNTYTWLTQNAQPYYNNSVCIENSTESIYQIDKGGVYLPNPSIFKSAGTINLYLYAGITNLYINNTEFTNFSGSTTIENDNIAIRILGTPNQNQVAYHFTISFSNNLPIIEPTPIPDPTQPRYEIVDVKSLMLQILTMPFTFITQAFNITLWPGTEYAFNFAHFIMALIAIASILFIIKLFTSGFSIVSNYTNTKINKSKPQKITKAEKPKKDKS